MKYYFEDIEKKKSSSKLIRRVAWDAFSHHCGVKKVGCDCIHFVSIVFEEYGHYKMEHRFNS